MKQPTATVLRALLGDDAQVAHTRGGHPVAAPQSEDDCALLLRTAREHGWRVRIQGGGAWIPIDTPADLTITTRGMNRLGEINAADLVATAGAGITWDALRAGLADHGVWVSLDQPGEDRTLGSAVATGTAGPLRAGFGPARDHLLGLTLVAGTGRVLRIGGKVVKNVAGYDLAKLAAGSFGAFGIITAFNLRLRRVPRADTTLVGEGRRDEMLEVARRVMEAGPTPAALEMFSPAAGGADHWTLAARCLGTDIEVEVQRQRLMASAGTRMAEIPRADAGTFWRERLQRVTGWPTTIRVGAVLDGLNTALDLIAHHVDETVEHWISVTVPAGAVRWSGSATSDRLRLLRHALAAHEMPLTLERAPWSIRKALGHYGAYREGVARLVTGLRHSFDPAGILSVPLGDA